MHEKAAMKSDQWNGQWLSTIRDVAAQAMQAADPGHGIDHVTRVVNNAQAISQIESVDPNVVLPAAWLHDCVLVPKNSPLRSSASRMAADHAIQLLKEMKYPELYLERIHHAVLAHSFSANVPCQTLDAKVVQDADRLEALGAIGIARCLVTTGHLKQNLYNIDEPFPVSRVADDRRFAVDHFFCKLLRLPSTMNTTSGKSIATDRLGIMHAFLQCLSQEIGCDPGQLELAIDRSLS